MVGYIKRDEDERGRDPIQTWCKMKQLYEVAFCLRTMNNIFLMLIKDVNVTPQMNSYGFRVTRYHTVVSHLSGSIFSQKIGQSPLFGEIYPTYNLYNHNPSRVST